MKNTKINIFNLFILTGLLVCGCEMFRCDCYCSNYDAKELLLNETVDLNFSALYCSSRYELRLSFDSISDSRCPIGAACIWEGNGRVKLHVLQSGKEATSFWLNTHASFLTDTTINGIRYELIDMLPYPEVGKDYSLDDYILQLRISD